jgi:hypothetical protein
MVDILIKEQPTISIAQVARDIHAAFRDRYTATADSVDTRIRRLMTLRDAAK